MVHIQCTLQQQVVTKLCELKSEFETWERFFLINNDLCAPTKCDRSGDSVITHLNNRIAIGNKILSNNSKYSCFFATFLSLKINMFSCFCDDAIRPSVGSRVCCYLVPPRKIKNILVFCHVFKGGKL